MTRLLLKLPWFLSAPAVLAIVAVLAIGGNRLLGTYFERTFLNEVDPLAAVAQAGAAPTAPAATSAANAVPTSPTPPAAATPATNTTAASPTPPVAAPGILAQGTFQDGDPGHHGSGTAKIIRAPDGSLLLRFEDFSVTNGPDVFVILSTDPKGGRSSAGDGLDLGGLRATDGNINYKIPGGTDVSQYKSVIVYCRSFKVVFAFATLEV